ncbi:MAG: cupin domain-containing protein [Desulfobacterales bacterium]|nr:cupin domain-containing protein [Desulfobacterales bacterium]
MSKLSVLKNPAGMTDLKDLGVHPAAIDSEPKMRLHELVTTQNGKVEAGIWECSEGTYRMERTCDEMCYLLEGHWIITGDDGESVELKAGDVVFLPADFKGDSKVIEKVKKVYMTA